MKTMTVVIAASILALTTIGCRQADQCKTDEQPASAASLKAPAAKPIDPRTQYDLVAAIREAQGLDPDDAEFRYDEIRSDFQGKRYRWQAFRIPALCSSAERCNVLAFDLTGKDLKKVVQGWMPRLQLEADTFAALDSKCTGQKRCSFEFEGTLDKLVLSTEHLTSLRFASVHIR